MIYIEASMTHIDSYKLSKHFLLQAEIAAELNPLLPAILDKAFKGEL